MTAGVAGTPADTPHGRERRRGQLALHAALILAACGFSLWVTRRGIVVVSDSLGYEEMARTALAGKPLTDATWPPGYPVALAAGMAAGLSFEAAARLLNHLCLPLSAGLFLWALRQLGCRPGTGTLLLLSLFCGSTVVLDVHWAAQSEPLFLPLCLAGLGGLLAAASLGGWRPLAGGALALGLAALVRYAGVFLAPVPILACAWSSRRSRVQTAVRAAAAGALTLVPSALFGLSAWSGRHPGGPRQVAVHPAGAEKLTELGRTALSWFFPTGLANVVPPAAGAACGALFALAWLALPIFHGARRERGESVVAAAGALYLAGVLASISLADYHIPLDSRILFPLYVLALLLIPSWGRLVGRGRARTALLVALSVFACASAGRTLRYGAAYARSHPGYNAATWRDAPFIPLVTALPPDVVVISNADRLVERYTGRPVLPMPRQYDAMTLRPTDDLRGLGERLRSATGARPRLALLILEQERRPCHEDPETVARALELTPAREGPGWRLLATPGVDGAPR